MEMGLKKAWGFLGKRGGPGGRFGGGRGQSFFKFGIVDLGGIGPPLRQCPDIMVGQWTQRESNSRPGNANAVFYH